MEYIDSVATATGVLNTILSLNEAANATHAALISDADSRVLVGVEPTNEE